MYLPRCMPAAAVAHPPKRSRRIGPVHFSFDRDGAVPAPNPMGFSEDDELMGISARSRPAAITGVTIFMAINGLMVLLNPMEGPDGAPTPGLTAASTLFGTLLL